MTMKDIKSLLAEYNLHEYNLCIELGVAKSTLNEWSHFKGFKGHESEVKSAIQKLIKKEGDKDDAEQY